MTDSYYDMPTDLAESTIDTAYLRSLLDKQKSTTPPQAQLGALQLGGNTVPVKLVIGANEVKIDMMGNNLMEVFPQMSGGGETQHTTQNTLLEHAKFFQQLHSNQENNQAGGAHLEDSYYEMSASTASAYDEPNARKMKLFDYVDTVGDA